MWIKKEKDIFRARRVKLKQLVEKWDWMSRRPPALTAAEVWDDYAPCMIPRCVWSPTCPQPDRSVTWEASLRPTLDLWARTRGPMGQKGGTHVRARHYADSHRGPLLHCRLASQHFSTFICPVQ